MAKPQGKKQQQAQDERDDGMREKMVAINRVTKVVKGGRILGLPHSRWLVMEMAASEWEKASPVKCP